MTPSTLGKSFKTASSNSWAMYLEEVAEQFTVLTMAM
jgi:hypothetical protein